jgi:catechol 2,3-dioxygenase-like lactoylglutathione lyase family enzyme
MQVNQIEERAMNSQRSFSTLAALYTVTLFGVMYLSGRSTERSVFEAYSARIKAVELTVKDVERASHFYTHSLGFRTIETRPGSESLLEIPGGVRLHLRRGEAAPQTLYIAVKNGFKGLHAAITKQSGCMTSQTTERTPNCITSVFKVDNQKVFVGVDPDQNRTVFYTANRAQQVPFLRD